MTEPFGYRVEIGDGGAVAIVTFDAPATRNALDRATRVALVDLFARLDRDRAVRVVVITGTDPAFSSGVDIRELGHIDYVPPAIDPATALRAMSTPVIAALNGACVSGGLEVALACSFMVASERATFADTHAGLGLIPGWGLSAELPAAIGMARARQLTFTAQAIDASTALAWGLVNEVVAHAELMPRVLALADAITRLGAQPIRAAVELYRDAHSADLAPAHRLECDARRDQSMSPHRPES
jgi:enoyl-CoA hydratase